MTDGAVELTGAPRSDPAAGPVSLGAAIEGRLGFLSLPTLAALRVAALLGAFDSRRATWRASR